LQFEKGREKGKKAAMNGRSPKKMEFLLPGGLSQRPWQHILEGNKQDGVL
jgi:hypothetical protein